MLKTLARPDCSEALHAGFAAFVDEYFGAATFEARPTLEGRAAELLPGLMLARIDGKSPVEYLVGKAGPQDAVRRFAKARLANPARSLTDVADAWWAGR